ncbi:3394_t:CDS:2 [Entrophospora sp. SA101]|nr:3394_t:CDS:2 [Entrophospora sp. SA101]
MNNDGNNIKNENNHTSPRYYDIKIGEKSFFLSSESLNNDAPNFFTAAFFGYFQESNTSKIFIERDPTYFDMIVRYLRGYEVDWPFHDKTEMKNLLADVRFYGFGNLQIILEEVFEQNFPKVVIPWKIITYAPENEPVLAINIKDIELRRWDGKNLIYDTNPILKKKINTSENTLTDNNVTDNNNNVNVDDNNTDSEDDNSTDSEDDNNVNHQVIQIESNVERGLYKLEIHGKDAFATVTSKWSNGIKFENFAFKNADEERTFKVLTESFRINNNNTHSTHNNTNSNDNAHIDDVSSLTLSPSLKLPFLKDSCIEIDNQKYHSYNDLSAYFGTTKGKPLYFEELVIRIDRRVYLMRAKAWTAPSYYASRPFIQPVNHKQNSY